MAFTHYVAAEDIKRGQICSYAEQGEYPAIHKPVRVAIAGDPALWFVGIALKDYAKDELIPLDGLGLYGDI